METPKEDQAISQVDVEKLTTAEQVEDESPQKESKLSFGNIVSALKRAVMGGNLTPQQAANMRRDMGISQGFFTSQKINPSKRKRIRKLAKKARMVTAKAGYKGQKMNKGKR